MNDAMIILDEDWQVKLHSLNLPEARIIHELEYARLQEIKQDHTEIKHRLKQLENTNTEKDKIEKELLQAHQNKIKNKIKQLENRLEHLKHKFGLENQKNKW